MKLWQLLRRGLTKWWFYPLAVLYLLFGTWLGALNYNVHQNPSAYGYGTKFVLYPIETVFRYGWFCVDKQDVCYFQIKDFRSSNSTDILAGASTKFGSYAKATHVTAMSIGWPVKVAVNLALIILIEVITFIVFVWTVSILVINVIFAILVSIVAKFFFWLLG